MAVAVAPKPCWPCQCHRRSGSPAPERRMRRDGFSGSVALGREFFSCRYGGKRGRCLSGEGTRGGQAAQQQRRTRVARGTRCRAFLPQEQPGEGSKSASWWIDVSHPRSQGCDGEPQIPFSARVEHKGTNIESYPKSRRRAWLLSNIALIIGLADPYGVPGLSNSSGSGSALSATADSPSAILNEAESGTSGAEQRQETPNDVKSWYRYRGEGFVLRIPPGYEDILDPGEEEVQDSSSLYGERAKDKPFAARFASPDRDEVLSIVVKRASQLRLSFFEANDISDFGSIKDAAPTFVPAGARLVSARIINSKASRVPRTYYVYEFLRKGTHFSMTAGVAKGRVFVLGASTPQAKWKDYSARLQLAAATFFLP